MQKKKDFEVDKDVIVLDDKGKEDLYFGKEDLDLDNDDDDSDFDDVEFDDGGD